MSADTQIQNGPQPMVAPHEVVYVAPSAIVSWTNEAGSRVVSLVEHNSALVAGIALADYVANPRAFSSERVSLFVTPYATVPHYDTRPVAGQSGAGRWVAIPATGLYPRPTDADAQKWWDALIAWVWRVADLTEESAITTAATMPADSAPVAVFGEAAEATVTMVGRQFREHAATVAATRPLFAAVAAYLDTRAGGLSATAAASAASTMSAAMALRDVLAKERNDVSARSQTRALVTLGVGLGAAYAYSRM